ncbi:PEP-CTERM sorting domain-containing protein [Roseateles sp. LYH14W]|uniref:PEP-CTERM sorting domain-containing protein n=1 Tax=Pelomonas parva TaxID=3299032 RepID=A0ABW7FBB4_9BURK
MNKLFKLSAFWLALIAGSANAGPIGISGFSGNETVTTFDNLNLPFQNTGALQLDGNTFATDNNQFRYLKPGDFFQDCTSECIANNAELGWLEVRLGSPTNRAGALVGGRGYAGFVDFFDTADNLLGSINFGGNPAIVFVGWEDLTVGIGRVRFTDTRPDSRILPLDDFRFEATNAVPLPGTLPLAGLALLGMRFVRRRQVA